ncbi:septum formation family protein [Arthrobacter sp. NPDC092385]|uniref:septum formation family protein n=1 Tax=Arthrobacter sp. NPDC092385 TaxID=3363943 RepID=UPI0037FD37B5
MSNEEQVPKDSGHDPETDARQEPDVVDPDDVVLDDGDIRTGALEPELSVSPDSLDLAEPSLEPARISRETADAASLEEAAAEARAVAAEAEETGTLVGGPMPADAPMARATPEGTAPAGGVAGDTEPTTTAGGGPAADGRTGAEAPGSSDGPADDGGPVGGPYAFPPAGGEAGAGDPGLYPGTDPASIGPAGAGPSTEPAPASGHGAPAARPAWVPSAPGALPGTGTGAGSHPTRDRTRARSSSLPLLLIIGGAVVLLGLLVWLLVSLFGGSDDEARVDPSSLASGECLADFTDITEDAVLVDCAEPHNAQLVASEDYPEDAEFPGRDQLGLRAEAACATASADIDPDVVTADLEVTLLRATPTAETWADGDRRVDCFAVVGNGGTVSQSLLNP